MLPRAQQDSVSCLPKDYRIYKKNLCFNVFIGGKNKEKKRGRRIELSLSVCKKGVGTHWPPRPKKPESLPSITGPARILCDLYFILARGNSANGGTQLNQDGSLRQNIISPLTSGPFPQSSANSAL